MGTKSIRFVDLVRRVCSWRDGHCENAASRFLKCPEKLRVNGPIIRLCPLERETALQAFLGSPRPTCILRALADSCLSSIVRVSCLSFDRGSGALSGSTRDE